MIKNNLQAGKAEIANNNYLQKIKKYKYMINEYFERKRIKLLHFSISLSYSSNSLKKHKKIYE